MKFGENLRNLRKGKKLSQEELAEKMHVSRQSVSKWETGDAYPEMNNILALCSIFHCRINDLVNGSIIDVASLDEEVKSHAIKFKQEEQAKMKGLSKAIAILAKIGRVITLICIPIVVVSMLLLGVMMQKISIIDNEIIFDGWNTSLKVVEENKQLSIKIGTGEIVNTKDQQEIAKIKNILENTSKPLRFAYVETGFLFLVISLVLMNRMLKSLENLFNNIHKGDTPFTLENVGYIKKIAYLMIATTILPTFVGIIFGILLKADIDIELELFSLVEILFLFSIAYIFQYGYEIQLDSKGKMYGEVQR